MVIIIIDCVQIVLNPESLYKTDHATFYSDPNRNPNAYFYRNAYLDRKPNLCKAVTNSYIKLIISCNAT